MVHLSVIRIDLALTVTVRMHPRFQVVFVRDFESGLGVFAGDGDSVTSLLDPGGILSLVLGFSTMITTLGGG